MLDIGGVSVFGVSPLLVELGIPPACRSDAGFVRARGWMVLRAGDVRVDQTVAIGQLFGCLSPPDSFCLTACPGLLYVFGGAEKKERNHLQKGHMKDIGSAVGETFLSLCPIPGGKITN